MPTILFGCYRNIASYKSWRHWVAAIATASRQRIQIGKCVSVAMYSYVWVSIYDHELARHLDVDLDVCIRIGLACSFRQNKNTVLPVSTDGQRKQAALPFFFLSLWSFRYIHWTILLWIYMLFPWACDRQRFHGLTWAQTQTR